MFAGLIPYYGVQVVMFGLFIIESEYTGMTVHFVNEELMMEKLYARTI